MSASCQVDFYVLGTPALDPRQLACRLALMAWEQGFRVCIIAATGAAARDLDELMWRSPPGRFLPHCIHDGARADPAPICIGLPGDDSDADVVINLDLQPVPEPARFSRLLEIVPHEKAERAASRNKYQFYRGRGIEPETHEVSG